MFSVGVFSKGVPSFQSIIDSIGSTHYNAGKYITKLLNYFTQN